MCTYAYVRYGSLLDEAGGPNKAMRYEIVYLTDNNRAYARRSWEGNYRFSYDKHTSYDAYERTFSYGDYLLRPAPADGWVHQWNAGRPSGDGAVVEQIDVDVLDVAERTRAAKAAAAVLRTTRLAQAREVVDGLTQHAAELRETHYLYNRLANDLEEQAGAARRAIEKVEAGSSHFGTLFTSVFIRHKRADGMLSE